MIAFAPPFSRCRSGHVQCFQRACPHAEDSAELTILTRHSWPVTKHITFKNSRRLAHWASHCNPKNNRWITDKMCSRPAYDEWWLGFVVTVPALDEKAERNPWFMLHKLTTHVSPCVSSLQQVRYLAIAWMVLQKVLQQRRGDERREPRIVPGRLFLTRVPAEVTKAHS